MKKFLYSILELLEKGGIRKNIAILVISTIFIAMDITNIANIGFQFSYIALVLCGLPIVLSGIIYLITDRMITASLLVAMAVFAGVYIGEVLAVAEVCFIMLLGEVLEERTVAKARSGIEKLIDLTPTKARVIRDGEELIINPVDVVVGDILKVLPGEAISVDGEIINGETTVDQAIMTGESVYVSKFVGDEVLSGTINQFGSFEMRATKNGEDSSIQRMIKLVQDTDSSNVRIANLADRWASWIVVAALILGIGTYFVTGEVIRAVTVLVVFCPCSLVLATPTAIMGGVANATRNGFLIRQGDAMERLAKVSKMAFDKTGTLTYGKYEVVDSKIESDVDSADFWRYVFAIEKNSEHPIAWAIVNHIKESYLENDLFEYTTDELATAISGRGIKGIVNGNEIIIGNKKLILDSRVDIDKDNLAFIKEYEEDSCTVVVVAINNKIAGTFALGDIQREESKEVIAEIHNLNIDTVMLTGDNKNVGERMAIKLGLGHVFAECLPEDKLRIIEENNNNEEYMCMIGDGVNDALAIKKAYVGIAMGGIGSDIAIDASDIVVINDNIKNLPYLIKLSRKVMTTIKRNLTFSLILNFLAIGLAMAGVLNPITGALVHNAGSIFVVLNSTRLLTWRC
ncbi:MAG: cation-translocating P-type ATPase [Eubacteriales bacterium]|nr:cation-translocating P-type ATPase [Eubacteriales bacterium]MDY3332315.1 cation-translocating P-type ATPase [Gallibacter sp.]